ncbi:MAG: hypothetical protein ACK5NY_01890 [Burkholderiaceae bacterium]
MSSTIHSRLARFIVAPSASARESAAIADMSDADAWGRLRQIVEENARTRTARQVESLLTKFADLDVCLYDETQINREQRIAVALQGIHVLLSKGGLLNTRDRSLQEHAETLLEYLNASQSHRKSNYILAIERALSTWPTSRALEDLRNRQGLCMDPAFDGLFAKPVLFSFKNTDRFARLQHHRTYLKKSVLTWRGAGVTGFCRRVYRSRKQMGWYHSKSHYEEQLVKRNAAIADLFLNEHDAALAKKEPLARKEAAEDFFDEQSVDEVIEKSAATVNQSFRSGFLGQNGLLEEQSFFLFWQRRQLKLNRPAMPDDAAGFAAMASRAVSGFAACYDRFLQEAWKILQEARKRSSNAVAAGPVPAARTSADKSIPWQNFDKNTPNWQERAQTEDLARRINGFDWDCAENERVFFQQQFLSHLSRLAGKPRVALDVVKYLKSADLAAQLNASLAPDGESPRLPADFLPNTPRIAWQVLSQVAQGPAGAAIIKAVLGPRSEIFTQDCGKAGLFFRACRQAYDYIDGFETPIDAIRGMAHGSVNAATELHKALRASALYMRGDAWESIPDVWTLGALKNDLMSARRNRFFNFAEHRLKKVDVWLQRAVEYPWYTFLSASLPWEKLVRRYISPSWSKTPFSALHKGTGGAERKTRDVYQTAYFEALSKTLDDLKTSIPDDIDNTIRNTRGFSQKKIRERVIRQAIIFGAIEQYQQMNKEYLAGLKNPPGANRTSLRFDGAGYKGGSLMLSVLSRAEQLLSKKAFRISRADIRKSSVFRRLTNAQIDLKLLDRWLDSLSFSAEDRKAIRDKHKLAKANDTLNRKTEPPEIITVETVANSLKDVAEHMQGSARLKLQSGGVTGISTKGLTYFVPINNFLLRVRVDGLLGWKRRAVYELGTTSSYAELVIGSQKSIPAQFGLWAAVGPSFGKYFNLTFGGRGVMGAERPTFSGVILRLPLKTKTPYYRRDQNGSLQLVKDEKGEPCPQTLAALQARLLTLQASPEYGSVETTVLETLLAEFPDLSVSVVDKTQEFSVTYSGSTETNFGAAVPGHENLAAVSLSAGFLGHYQPRNRRSTVEASGYIRIQREVIGRESNLSAFAAGGWRPVKEAFSFGDGFAFNMEVARAEASLYNKSALARFELPTEGGFLTKDAYYEVEHPTLSSLSDSMANKELGKQAPFDFLSRDETEKMHRFLQGQSLDENKLQRFAERHCIKPSVVEQYNRLTAQANACRAGSAEAVRRADELYDEALALAKDPANYDFASLRVYERFRHETYSGLNLAIQVQRLNGLEGTHVAAKFEVKRASS